MDAVEVDVADEATGEGSAEVARVLEIQRQRGVLTSADVAHYADVKKDVTILVSRADPSATPITVFAAWHVHPDKLKPSMRAELDRVAKVLLALFDHQPLCTTNGAQRGTS